ncbi:hypothetical protein ACFL0K_00030 [Patescibacteria group bacterium]
MQDLIKTTKIIVLAFVIAAGASYVYAWTGPTSQPPNANADSPINVGVESQYKDGAFGVGGLLRGYADLIVDGGVGIGTETPTATLEVVGDIRTNGYSRSDTDNGNFRTTQQDGGGRYHQAWNVEGTSIYTGTYEVTGDPALWIRWSTDGWTFKTAAAGTAGDTIVWTDGANQNVDGTFRAKGGLVIETRTSDPVSPVSGQMWLRTDL